MLHKTEMLQASSDRPQPLQGTAACDSLKKTWRDGSAHVVLSPSVLIERLLRALGLLFEAPELAVARAPPDGGGRVVRAAL